MTDDNTILEMAAKAAGLDGYIREWCLGPEFIVPGEKPVVWDPLKDNLDAANGDQLIHLSTSPDPKVQADALDAARLLYATKDYDGYVHVKRDKYEFTLECMEEAGRSEPTIEDELNGVRRLIDAAIAAQAESSAD